jgi:hypothetical protein
VSHDRLFVVQERLSMIQRRLVRWDVRLSTVGEGSGSKALKSCIGWLARASTSRCSSTSTAVWSKISTSSALAPWSALFKSTTTSLVHSSACTSISVSTVSIGFGSAGLNVNLFSPNGVRVRGSSSGISFGGGIFNKSTVL